MIETKHHRIVFVKKFHDEMGNRVFVYLLQIGEDVEQWGLVRNKFVPIDDAEEIYRFTIQDGYVKTFEELKNRIIELGLR